METALSGYYEELPLAVDAPPQALVSPRARWAPLAFLFPLALCAMSWAAGGVALLTDVGFVGFTLICFSFCVIELIKFPQRNGVGALMLYGGVIVWFCFDYLNIWMGTDFALMPFPPVTIAKAATLHVFFVMMMGFGLVLPYGKWIEKMILKLPEAKSGSYYFFLVILFFLLGILPYLLFTEDGFPQVFIKSITNMRAIGAEPVRWTVGRTGNLNYSWGGYVAQWVDAGYLGGLFAAFYAVLIARSIWPKFVAWLIWGFWMAMAFGTGTRGQVVFMGLPVIALVYMKSQQLAAARGKRLSTGAYWRSLGLLLFVLVLVQFQGKFRNIRHDERSGDVELFKVAGNSMFSEGLLAYRLIPEVRPFFFDRFPGEAILRPIPEFVFLLVSHPVPRALWTSKPVDPLWQWYNSMVTGRGTGLEGTTISHGLVGNWYFKYGLAGIIEGGLLMGLMYSIAERTLSKGVGRPMVTMISLGLLTWLFRCFRDVTFPELWALLLGFLVLTGLIWIGRIFGSAKT